MPFVYRLQKVLKYRIQEKDKQLDVVKKARQEILRIQAEIDKKYEEIKTLRKEMFAKHHIMINSFDLYIEHINKIIEKLEEDKKQAEEVLRIEMEKLAELEKGINALEKHKEKVHEVYLQEEKDAEMRALNEIASIKHFSETRRAQEEELEDIKALASLELLKQERELDFD